MNLKCFPSLFFFKINLEEAFASVLDRQKYFPDYRNIDFLRTLLLGFFQRG